ncbi:hypothetical protein OUZ56_008356 [Daphnia magna]|uniref:Uncharacterized protein n=1 Tax=Daphnia magna TaxID=35525 RepID=A0ABR0ACR2_9CRUS|nr:hypothetical protein OUZ56_008356 [Daphnia magna]
MTLQVRCSPSISLKCFAAVYKNKSSEPERKVDATPTTVTSIGGVWPSQFSAIVKYGETSTSRLNYG